MRAFLIIICILILGLAGYTVYITSSWDINTASFLILTFTLIALVFYAYHTFSIASVNKAKWERESIARATYSMEMATQRDRFRDRTLFRLTNLSDVVVRAKVQCNFRIYGDRVVSAHDEFEGKSIWIIFPQQMSQGWFELSPLLTKKGKMVDQMIEETSVDNEKEQLTMDLEIEFRDELGNIRTLPSRKHYFKFEATEFKWIPVLTLQGDWTD